MREIIDLVVVEEKYDARKDLVTVVVDQPDINLLPNQIGLIVPAEGNEDKVVLNPLYTGGELSLRIRNLKIPARKYKAGEIIARLVIL